MLAAVLAGSRTLSSMETRRALVWAGGLLAADFVIHSGILPGAAPGRILGDLPAALGFAAIVAVAAASTRSLRLLESRALAAAGTISYGVYLWNVPVLLTLRGLDLLPLTTWAALPVVLVPTVLIATLSWLFVERPAIEWARAPRRRTPAPAARRREPAFAETRS
jgi:peptidoglycan/LPS O-acetylase OafA/YrhL